MGIVRTERIEARPEFGQRETIDTRIDFANRTLFRCRGFFLDDRLHAAFGISNDATVIGGISQLGAENCRRRFAPAMGIKQRGERIRS